MTASPNSPAPLCFCPAGRGSSPRSRPAGLIVALLLSLLLALTSAMATAAEEPDVSPQQLEELEERIGEISAWLDDAEEDRSDLADKVKELQQELGKINARLHQLEAEQRRLETRLTELDEEGQALKDSLASQREALSAQLRSAWMQGEAPGLKVLLNESDPQQLARQMTYYDYLSRDALDRLETFQQTLEALQLNRQQALESRAELDQAKRTAEARQEERRARQDEHQQALAALDREISEHRSELQQLQADRTRLEGLLKQVQEAVRALELPDASEPFADLAGNLPWPARGKLLAHYGDSMAGGKLRRNGIVIDTSAQSPVQAVHYGRVVFADWLRGFGLLVIIDHGDGYMSLYGQNSGLLQSVGDWVSAGETVALAGNSGGSPPGLYFEIRKDGRPSDPQKWLTKR